MPPRFSFPAFASAVACVCATVLFLVAGCGHKEGAPSSEAASAPASVSGAAVPVAPTASGDAAAKTTGGAEGKTEPPALPRKIIYTAAIALVTDDWSRSAAQIVREAKARNGYIAENSITGEPNTPREGTWKIRIPLPEFENFLSALGKMGEIKNTSITSQDVSEEFYDVRARLQNKRVEEARLIELLQKSAGKLSDILLLEKEISRVREEIERMEGRLRFLANQTDLATVTVTLHEAQPFKKPDAPPTFGSQIAHTFGESTGALLDFGRGLVLFVVAVLPWAIVPGIALYFMLRRRQRREKERTTKNERPKFDL